MAKPKHPLSPRAMASLVISKVIQQHSLNTVLPPSLAALPENERSLCQQLCYGVLRWQPLLAVLYQQLLSKPLKSKHSDIQALLLVGLYQLRSLRVPEHAALSETVNACQQLGKPWAKGLVNACLRNYVRQQAEFEAKLDADTLTAHPLWMLNQFREDWPDKWPQIIAANNQQPPMIIRVNRQHSDSDQYLQQLNAAGIEASKLDHCPDGLLLNTPCDVQLLPGFDQGQVSVQDGAAQRVVELMDLLPGLRVLDACAAPGGKTCHMLERMPDINMTALDIDAKRLQQIRDNLSRLSLSARLIAADASDISHWWQGEQFDRILIDAPCSGSGVIRRHPDIKQLRKPQDIAAVAERQRQLLDNLWPLLKPDGLMVYTTCSAFKQENGLQVDAFLQRHPDAAEVAPLIEPATKAEYGYQRLPGDDPTDGFFYACLRHH